MSKQHWLSIILTCALPVQASGHQTALDIHTLYTQLRDPSATNRAAQRILRAASRDTNARDYISKKLPDIIEQTQMDQVWRNAVRLAGQLQAPDSVPALVRVLPRSPFKPAVILFGEILSLSSDPVGEALREIGDPAVPALGYLLEHDSNSTDRWRAARILWNIDSPSSRKVMHDDLQHESDRAIRQFTEGKSRP
jgi:HEAT repeat protein